jgi:hypothetical protein
MEERASEYIGTSHMKPRRFLLEWNEDVFAGRTRKDESEVKCEIPLRYAY